MNNDRDELALQTSHDTPAANILLNHFTSSSRLRAIARYGLTIGDVPTDIPRNRGTVGAWLTSATGSNTAGSFDTWYVFFGIIAPSLIRMCVEMTSGNKILNWAELSPQHLDRPGVPGWRRAKWHKALVKRIAPTLKRESLVTSPIARTLAGRRTSSRA